MTRTIGSVVPLSAVTQAGSTAWIVTGWLFLGIAFACALAITWDIVARGYRQHMAIMNAVYPITARYWGRSQCGSTSAAASD